MAESVLLAVVRGVAGKAANELVQTVTRVWSLDRDRETLQLHLLAIQRKLASAEEMSRTDDVVKAWLKKLKEVADEADDVLEDFRYEALRGKAQMGESTTRRVISNIIERPISLLEMSRKLKNVLHKINKLVEDMNKFSLVNCQDQTGGEEPPRRQTHSKLDEFTEIFGRDDEKDVVVKLLLDQQDQRRVQVLPIFGMGGLGKTTFAKMVYNDQRIQQHFQEKMWHCVSDNFDVISILKSTIQLAKKKVIPDLPDSIELLLPKLEKAIGRQRFLLVMDDVWNEDRTLWEDDLKPLLCSVGGPGSVILVTCRSMEVASIMSTVTPYMLKFLSEVDSWKLFSMKAFSNGVEEQEELVTIGRRIVDKCGGLPLALKTMGGLLSSKQKLQQWKAIEECKIGDNGGGNNGVMSILMLSYKHLSSETKRCFAMCSLFYKDYEMEKGVLIQLWMANGLIQEENTTDLAQKGEDIFNDLVQRSFLQDIKVVVRSGVYYDSTEYETTVCKMHDLMHDLARDVSDECATIEDLIKEKPSVKDVRHLQMSPDVKFEKIKGLFKDKKSSLRTLLGPSEIRLDFNELPVVSLRAFHCSGFIRSNAINSKYLRYLDLSDCTVKDSLLDSICLLYNLQTLKLNECCLEFCSRRRNLPEDMLIRLRKLIHIYLLGCKWLEKMPPKIGELSNLRTLTTFVVDTVSGCGIEELKDLQHLSNRLELYNLRKIKSVNHAEEANLQHKQNLSELLFCWGLNRYGRPENEACNEKEVFQCLQPHDKIKIIELYGYGGLEMPQWMGYPQMFKCLRKLKISKCTRCKNIPLVWLSSSLVYLSLEDMDELKSLCDNLGTEGGSRQIFPQLKEMRLKNLGSLERWVKNSVGEDVDSFPVLEEVVMEDCPMLASFPLSPTLKVMRVIRCCTTAIRSNVEGNASSSEEETIQLARLDSPRLPASLEVLWIQSCASWVALPPNLGDLAMLRELLVNNCYSLEAFPDGMDGLTSLRELTISRSGEMEEFPDGLLQRLPALEYLSIDVCHELGRRFIEGGEYFDLVSSIPRKYIPLAERQLVLHRGFTIGEPEVELETEESVQQVEESGIEATETESGIEATETGIEAPEPESRTEAQSGTEAAEAESRGNKFLRRLVPCCARSKSDSN
uniref:Uncharacterized protein n=1 Tax=Avena sativa TaxID=4498 RepID=A0ACD5ZDH7_AVESA